MYQAHFMFIEIVTLIMVSMAVFIITGRQRDVENVEYLIIFLRRDIEKSVIKYKKELSGHGVRQKILARVKAYRLGFVKRISSRMYECQDQFFTSEKKIQDANGTEII